MSSYHQAIEIASSSSSTITTTADNPDEYTALLSGSPASKPSPYLEISAVTANNNSNNGCKISYVHSVLYIHQKDLFYYILIYNLSNNNLYFSTLEKTYQQSNYRPFTFNHFGPGHLVWDHTESRT